MKRREFINTPVGQLCGAPGHHSYFLNHQRTKELIFSFSDYIHTQGIEVFLKREYPAYSSKKIIINQIAETLYIVDGNKHLVSLLLAKPDLTLADLLHCTPGIIRFWDKGIDAAEKNPHPYEVFIPIHINTTAISRARNGFDNFKAVPEPIWIIPADVPFDSLCFKPGDRGEKLQQTVDELSILRITMF